MGTKSATRRDAEREEAVVEFVCEPALRGEIPEPKAASNVLPEWYKRLEGRIEETLDLPSTVRMCPAFLDALSLGWILPFEADVRVDNETGTFDDGGAGLVREATLGDGTLPEGVARTVRFRSRWGVRLPEGYSLLVMQPMNRREQRFKVVGEVVDADAGVTAVEVGAFWYPDAGNTIIREGEPLVQVVPFKRDSRVEDALVRPFGEDGERSYRTTKRQSKVNRSHYREEEWTPKGTRVLRR